jgi:DNA-binding NtrC family response regulator
VERAVLMCEGGTIEAHDLALSEVAAGELAGGFHLRLPPEGIALEEIERMAIEEALRRCGYVQKDAARLLRVTRRQLNYAIRRMGLTHPSWRTNRAADG